MNTTPAVGVSAGRIGGRFARRARVWLPAFRSALLLPAVSACLVVSLVASLAFGAAPAAAAQVNSLGLSAEYDVHANIKWSDGSMTVSSTSHVRNTTDNSVGRLAFNLLPLRLGRLRALTASVGGEAVTPAVADQTVIVALAKKLGPGEKVDVTIGYRAFFSSNTSGKKALFMKKDGIAAAYRWIPWLSRQQKFDTPNFGESWVTGTSRRVRVTFTADKALVFASSGKPLDTRGLTQTFEAQNVRDFNFAVSPDYKIKRVNWNGIKVRVFYKTQEPQGMMSWTLRALERFSDKVGRYPYDHFNVAETPAGTGMESPAMTWIDATLPKSRFAYIVVHETAHQWFYSAVGNNQGTQPFVDEALADFLTRDLIDGYRESECARARLDKTTYDYNHECYNEIVYVQGGLYLRDYKEAVGNAVFWKGLHNFYRDFRFKVAGTRDLFDYLDAASGFKSRKHAERFPSLY